MNGAAQQLIVSSQSALIPLALKSQPPPTHTQVTRSSSNFFLQPLTKTTKRVVLLNLSVNFISSIFYLILLFLSCGTHIKVANSLHLLPLVTFLPNYMQLSCGFYLCECTMTVSLSVYQPETGWQNGRP